MKRVAGGWLIAAIATAVLTGCSISRTFGPDYYTVQRGDTLSEIALRYNLDWHDLARWNHIDPPYRIDVGQRLALEPYPQLNYADMSGSANRPVDRTGPPPGPNDYETSSNGTTTALPSRGRPSVSPLPDDGSSEPSSRTSTDSRTAETDSANQSADQDSIDSATTSQSTQRTTVQAGGPNADGWQWPASGELVRAYDASARRRGLEIGGEVGAPVYAASSGTVVYNGTGLKGYGKLIIIKHDEHYLSAYGFNQTTLVEQGQTVAAGAHIADMGLGPGNKPMLHFEVRKDGEPIDPQTVLPKR